MLTFEEFSVFCQNYGLSAFEEARKIDEKSYLQMQIADYVLNNNDRHEQNWGFLVENSSGKIIGYVPLFDHDHAFSEYENLMSQTREETISLQEAAIQAQNILQMDLHKVYEMEKPELLSEKQWQSVLDRIEKLMR